MNVFTSIILINALEPTKLFIIITNKNVSEILY